MTLIIWEDACSHCPPSLLPAPSSLVYTHAHPCTHNGHTDTHWPSRASLVAQLVKNLPAMREPWVQSLGWEDPLEKGMVTTCSTLAWRIPMDRGAWWTIVHGVAKRWTRLSTAACTFMQTHRPTLFLKVNFGSSEAEYFQSSVNKVKRRTSLVVQGLKNKSACQCRRHGFNAWSGKIPHASEQLSPCTTMTEPVLLSLRATTVEPLNHNY